MAPGSFAALPAHERQAFFSLLDEYFESRPHLMPGGGAASAAQQTTSTIGYAPAPTASSSAAPPSPAARSQPPAPAARKTGPVPPAGLSAGKSIGRINMQSKGTAFGSMIMGKPRPQEPATPGEAIAGARVNSRGAPPPAPLPRTTAPPPPVDEEAPTYGQAEALYDYIGAEAEDLSVKRFEVVDLIEKISEDWWKARSIDGSGRTGIVPSSYVKQI